ncbi:MAG: efflux RND transporter periplasmic adaptor subunit [Bacteroidales bacterium]|nr:efflux RND transporter periplasmic adaptor subunit [Bacteroidales bacterium]
MRLSTITLLAATLLSLCCSGCTHETEKTSEAVRVEVYTTSDSAQAEIRNYVGTIEGVVTTTLSFPAGGYVEHVRVHEGDYVHKGQSLVTLETTTAQSALQAADATLKQAEDGYRRLKQVYDQGSLAEVKWVEMQTKLQQAQSTQRIAAKNLADCNLRAPFSGYVGECSAENGMNLLPMQPVITLHDVERVNVLFTVPENEIASLNVGDTGTIVVAALDNKTFQGKVVERGVVADALAHSYNVKIEIDNRDHALLPGMVGRVLTTNKTGERGYVIPAKAVQTGRDGTFVWLVVDGHATRRAVTVAHYVGGGVAITGVEPGEQVVTSGYLKIGEGTEVCTE